MHIKRSRDKDKTINDILPAAKKLFSQKGLHGTSVQDIANASCVSKGLILHHFSTKEQLYAAVQDVLAQEYITVMDKRLKTTRDFREMVAMVIRRSLAYSKHHPDYRRVLLWSYLEGQERNPDLEQRFSQDLVAAMRAGQQSGVVRNDIDAFLMPFIIKGTIDYWLQKEKLVQYLATDAGNRAESPDERLIDALTKLFLI